MQEENSGAHWALLIQEGGPESLVSLPVII